MVSMLCMHNNINAALSAVNTFFRGRGNETGGQ